MIVKLYVYFIKLRLQNSFLDIAGLGVNINRSYNLPITKFASQKLSVTLEDSLAFMMAVTLSSGDACEPIAPVRWDAVEATAGFTVVKGNAAMEFTVFVPLIHK